MRQMFHKHEMLIGFLTLFEIIYQYNIDWKIKPENVNVFQWHKKEQM